MNLVDRIRRRIAPLRRRRGIVVAAATVVVVLGVWRLALRFDPPPDPFAERPPGVRVLARDGSLLRGYLSPDEKWRWRLGLDEMSPLLVEAVLHHEDHRFREHPGVDAAALARAALDNLRNRRVVSGASTLTMQLARIVEPRRRTLGAKIHQIYRALQYERRYDKDEILALYLNLAPYGGNIEGAGTAARLYFGKSTRDLSPAEAALLAVLPQSPTARSPLRHPEAAREARNRLLDRLADDGAWSHETVVAAKTRPVPDALFAPPREAPHFADWAVGGTGLADDLRTTLDPDLQREAAALTAEHARRLHELGVDQAAAVILHAETGELLAMVGSADFDDAAHAGQVNGAVAPRSPGSTLKPLVFALAYDRGLAAPATLLADAPRAYGSYAPKNYDGEYRGVVPAAEALQRSLNVPAVALAADLERRRDTSLHAFLRAAGVRSLDRPAEHYGLSLVLGGGETTLLELASLYGLLARQGTRLPVRWNLDGEASAAAPLLSPEACWLVLRDMVDVERPDLEAVWRGGSGNVPVPWKTGTSYGHRDAWSVGVAGPYVVAVWAGNFDGVGSPHLTGRGAAAPLLFRLVEILPRHEAGRWHMRPDGVALRRVCSVTGATPSAWCPHVTEAWCITGVSPAAPCDVHRVVAVDDSTGYEVCSRCRRPGAWSERAVTWWPPAVAGYIRDRRETLPHPPHTPDCPSMDLHAAPVIVSPTADAEIFLREGAVPGTQSLALRAEVHAGCREVFWFVDGAPLGRADPSQTFFYEPTLGDHAVSVVDDGGATASVTISVRAATATALGCNDGW